MRQSTITTPGLKSVGQYNDVVPAPSADRVQTAFNRMLQPGGIYEAQLIGENQYGDAMYHVYQTPDLRHCVTATIERKSTVARVTWHTHEDQGRERTGKDLELHQRTQDAVLVVPITARTSDARIIYAAHDKYREVIQTAIEQINRRESLPIPGMH
jgi:hypothetical protein